jgi:hypothetical protein
MIVLSATLVRTTVSARAFWAPAHAPTHAPPHGRADAVVMARMANWVFIRIRKANNQLADNPRAAWNSRRTES